MSLVDSHGKCDFLTRRRSGAVFYICWSAFLIFPILDHKLRASDDSWVKRILDPSLSGAVEGIPDEAAGTLEGSVGSKLCAEFNG